MINVFKENKRLKKEIEDLESSLEYYRNKDWIKMNGYTITIDRNKKLEEKVKQLQKELTELYEKNYELAKKLTNDTTDKIKEFINELEHNIQVDKSTDVILMSGVACDYVIKKLKDIIK